MCSLSVVCKINDDGDIESIEQTYGIEETLPEKFTSRLEALAQLSTGWYGTQDGVPQGEPIKDSIFKNVQSFLCEALSYTSSIPQIIDLVIFPQINGGIQIEWTKLISSLTIQSMRLTLAKTKKIARRCLQQTALQMKS